MYVEQLVVKKECDGLFKEELRHYAKDLYLADTDTISFVPLEDKEVIGSFLAVDYERYNSGQDSLQYYTLYAVCLLGVCDQMAILKFITLSVKGTPLEEEFINVGKDEVKGALKRFIQTGLIMRHMFEPEGSDEKIALYLPTQNGLMVLKNALQKEGMKEIYAPIMPPFRLLGKATSTFVSLEVAELLMIHEMRVRFKDGFFNTFVGGHLFMNNVLDLDGAVIGFTDLFLGFNKNKNYLSFDSEYLVNSKIHLVEQFGYYIKGIGKNMRIVICVSEMSEIETFIQAIFKTRDAEPFLEDIYFTTEMAFRDETTSTKFMKIVRNSVGNFVLMPVSLYI